MLRLHQLRLFITCPWLPETQKTFQASVNCSSTTPDCKIQLIKTRPPVSALQPPAPKALPSLVTPSPHHNTLRQRRNSSLVTRHSSLVTARSASPAPKAQSGLRPPVSVLWRRRRKTPSVKISEISGQQQKSKVKRQKSKSVHHSPRRRRIRSPVSGLRSPAPKALPPLVSFSPSPHHNAPAPKAQLVTRHSSLVTRHRAQRLPPPPRRYRQL